MGPTINCTWLKHFRSRSEERVNSNSQYLIIRSSKDFEDNLSMHVRAIEYHTISCDALQFDILAILYFDIEVYHMYVHYAIHYITKNTMHNTANYTTHYTLFSIRCIIKRTIHRNKHYTIHTLQCAMQSIIRRTIHYTTHYMQYTFHYTLSIHTQPTLNITMQYYAIPYNTWQFDQASLNKSRKPTLARSGLCKWGQI